MICISKLFIDIVYNKAIALLEIIENYSGLSKFPDVATYL